MTRASLIEAAARRIAAANGDADFDALPLGKAEWVQGRGMFAGRYRDINEPMRADYVEMAEAAFAFPPGEAWIAPWKATDAMRDAGYTNDAFRTQDIMPCSLDYDPNAVYHAMRDAHLKETEPDAK